MTIDVVDDADRPIGTILRGAVLGSGLAFRTVHVFLLSSTEELLVQRLAEGRPRHAGCWGSSVAAYLHAGETYEAAARRRLREELDLRADSLEEVGKLEMPEEGARKFVALYVARSAGTVRAEPSLIAEVRWRTPSAIALGLRDRPSEFTPTFGRLFQRFRRAVFSDDHA